MEPLESDISYEYSLENVNIVSIDFLKISDSKNMMRVIHFLLIYLSIFQKTS